MRPLSPSTASITQPDGWALLDRLDNPNATSSSLAIFWTQASLQPASSVWNLGAGHTGAAVALMSYSGFDANFLCAYGGQATPFGFQHAAPSITPTTNRAMVVSFHAYGSSNPWPPPSGMTEDVDVSTLAAPSSNGIALEVNHLVQGFAAATGSLEASVPNDGNVDVGNAFVLALRPANAAPTLNSAASPSLGFVNEDPGPPSGAVGCWTSGSPNSRPRNRT